MMTPLRIISGLILLLLGRQLFWLFVAVVGFIAGMDIGRQLIQGNDLMVLLLGVFAGVVGAALASFFYEVAIAIAGFLAGGRIGVELISALAPQWMGANWVPFVVGGVIGAAVLLIVFDWALIVISSLLGANLIVSQLSMEPAASAVTFVLLAIAGIALQAGMMRRRSPR